ncbi:hypothetical protein CI105_00935 [Candidatus Izimaplasma bacterium ZiA1]|uniref:hypothetical protein n=1 Tax=Candidatus Izimoplasma sp. ZiA1 TaxID=2024899 RepID=UPI000BAA6788|nr:hypothetical protein CI105_00935 [Candidatus Izimaplasma bacterium ZiA1]
MLREPNKYVFSQLETYKEKLELEHLKKKTIIVNMLVFLLGALVLYLLLKIGRDFDGIMPLMLTFIFFLIVNFSFYSYKQDHYNYLKILMYGSVIFIYFISIMIVFEFQTPSSFTGMFLAYAVTSIYQDYKSIMLSNFTLFLTGSLLVVRFPEIFSISNGNNPDTFIVLVFLLVFVLLLTLSSLILIKRKTFFYNQLAYVKEAELRNIRLLLNIQKILGKNEINQNSYYDKINAFSKAVSSKIGVDDIFKYRLILLEDLCKLNDIEFTNKYTDVTIEEKQYISQMRVDILSKIRTISIKASQSFGIKVSKKEVFAETQFKSFKHSEDSNYSKIISFVTFYTLLKINKPYLKALDEEELRDVLLNSEYFHKVDRDIMNIYLQNSEVFDTIVNAHLKEDEL